MTRPRSDSWDAARRYVRTSCAWLAKPRRLPMCLSLLPIETIGKRKRHITGGVCLAIGEWPQAPEVPRPRSASPRPHSESPRPRVPDSGAPPAYLSAGECAAAAPTPSAQLVSSFALGLRPQGVRLHPQVPTRLARGRGMSVTRRNRPGVVHTKSV